MTFIPSHSRFSSLLLTGAALSFLALAGCGRSRAAGSGGVNFRSGGNGSTNSSSNNGTANAGTNTAPALAASLASLNTSQAVTTVGPYGAVAKDKDDVVHDSRTTEIVIEFQCNKDCVADTLSSDEDTFLEHEDKRVQVAANRVHLEGHFVVTVSAAAQKTVHFKLKNAAGENVDIPVTFTVTGRSVPKRDIFRAWAANHFDWMHTDVWAEKYAAGWQHHWGRHWAIYAEEFVTAKTQGNVKVYRCAWYNQGTGHWHHYTNPNGCGQGATIDRLLGYAPANGNNQSSSPFPGMVPAWRAYHLEWNGSAWSHDGLNYEAPYSEVISLANQGGDPGWRIAGYLGFAIFP